MTRPVAIEVVPGEVQVLGEVQGLLLVKLELFGLSCDSKRLISTHLCPGRRASPDPGPRLPLAPGPRARSSKGSAARCPVGSLERLLESDLIKG